MYKQASKSHFGLDCVNLHCSPSRPEISRIHQLVRYFSLLKDEDMDFTATPLFTSSTGIRDANINNAINIRVVFKIKHDSVS